MIRGEFAVKDKKEKRKQKRKLTGAEVLMRTFVMTDAVSIFLPSQTVMRLDTLDQFSPKTHEILDLKHEVILAFSGIIAV